MKKISRNKGIYGLHINEMKHRHLIRTDLKQKFRAHPSLKHAEEYDIWLQVSKYARDNGLSIRYSSLCTSVYRMHKEQTWNSVRRLSHQEKGRQYLNFIRGRNK